MPGYFSVDERRISDFLAFIAEYSDLIEFYDPEAVKRNEWKSWKEVFVKDISIVLASIVAIDIDTIDQGFEHLVEQVKASYDPVTKSDKMDALFEYLVLKAGELPKWLEQVIRQNAPNSSLEGEVETEIWKVIDQKLRGALIRLNDLAATGQEHGMLRKFQEVPFPDFGHSHGDRPDLWRGETSMARIDRALVEVRSIYHIVLSCLAYSRTHFQKYFDRSLAEKSDHAPEVSLFITFLQLYQYAQKDINELTLRHLEYYYKAVLKQDFRPSISDAVHVCFELVRTSNSCRLPKGTKLFAGRNDDGTEIYYATTEEVEINQAEVSSLKSVFISRVLEGQTWTYKLVTSLYGAPVANSRDGKGGTFDPENRDWPLFGEEQYKAGRRTMSHADLGFAISSPMFMLHEGTRKVKIHLTFKEEPEVEGTYRKLIEDLSQGSDEESLKYALLEVFGRGKNCAFNILLSSEDGWIDVAEEASNELYIESKPWNWNKITIAFTIPASCPPITPIDPAKMNPEGFGSKFPVAKFVLNPRKTPFGYTFLETLRFEEVGIEVEVDKVKNLVLCNDLGRLDSTQPVQAFGPVPVTGSYLLVGNAEVFRKKLTDIKFNFEWQNLPHRGFRAYFKEYFADDSEITEEMFKVHLSALSGYEFKPGEKEDPIVHQIFPKEPGKRTNVLAVKDPGRLQIRVNPDLRSVDYFDSNTPIGFFKLELKEPMEAFGHSIYQERLGEIAQHNAQIDEDEKLRFPNPPFSPLISAISLSYKAVDKIIPDQFDPASRNEIYHLHPFGSAPVYSRGQLKMKQAALVPEYRDDGYLYIGLKNLQPPQELSLLFQLAAGKTTFTAQLPEMEWSYLSNNDWESLKTIDLLSDTTERFTKTGIIRLRIPAGMSSGNGVLPKGMHWLRIAIRGNTENVSRALEVRTQAAMAEWISNGDPDHLRKPLPAGSIKGVAPRRPEIRKVIQPYASFHARPAEVREEFFQRVSERLRHKRRAVTHWDFERIILDEFHTVAQVKCLSHISDPDFIQPGELRVVVIPGINQATDKLTPKVNHGTLLSIQNFLREHASPFIQLRVSNPSYEYIRVNCRVKFAENKNNGDSLEKLRKDIREFICPWLNEVNQEIEIGGNLKAEDLYRFIRSLPYVDFVTKFALLHFYVDDETTGVYQLLSTADPRLSEDERSFIRARKPWSVLIPDSDHEIEFTEREVHAAPDFSLEPVDFQGRFQISPHLIKIVPKAELPGDNPDIRYEQEDTLRIFVNVPD